MPKVKQVTANKDHPKFGIVKGQKHFHWTLKTGPTSSREFRQVTPPKRSQLTTSEFLSGFFDLIDEIDEMVHDEGLPDTLTDFAERVRDLGTEQQDKFDNMPEGLQQGPTGEMLQERAGEMESWADEIESAADELREKIETIDSKAWNELDAFSHIDPDDDTYEEASDKPTDEEIEEARDAERTDAFVEAVDAVSNATPGF